MARILVIDDDITIREFLTLLLESEGHDVAAASDGEEGIRAFQVRPADLVITDLVMPMKNGIEVIQALKRDEPALPIIAITGTGGRERISAWMEKAVEAGACNALPKPFQDHELIAAVDDALNDG